MQILKASGLWWDAGNPEVKLGGNLVFDDLEGVQIDLIGAFGGIKALLQLDNVLLVHGVADNKLFTIFSAQTKSISTKHPGPHSQVLVSNRLFVGAHLEEKYLFFDQVDIEMDYLAEFVDHSSLSHSLSSNKSGEWSGVKAEVATQKPVMLGPIRNGEASITFGWGQKGENFRSVTLSEKCFFTLKFKKPMGLDRIYEEYVRPLQDLVTMATDRPNVVTTLGLRNPEILNNHPQPRSVKIELLQRFSVEPGRRNKTLLRPDMLFTLRDLNEKQVRRWLLISKRYQPVVGIVFGQRYAASSVHLENQLLNAVSAIEAYHRRRFSNNIAEKNAWRKRKKAIISRVDNSDKDLLHQALQFANEKKLKQRLDETLSYTGLIGKNLVIDPRTWNDKIRSYRNTLTHYDPDSPQEITDYETLYWLAKSISWIMLACLMIEAGFSKKKILALFKENQRYIFESKRIEEILIKTD